jgi:hypothetical protein
MIFNTKFHVALHASHAVLPTLTSKISLKTQLLQTFQNITMQTSKHKITKKHFKTKYSKLFLPRLTDSPLPMNFVSSCRKSSKLPLAHLGRVLPGKLPSSKPCPRALNLISLASSHPLYFFFLVLFTESLNV